MSEGNPLFMEQLVAFAGEGSAPIELAGRLHLGTAEKLPFPDNSFDCVISLNTIHNFSRPRAIKAMAELYPIDQIFDNAGYAGILSNALIEVGIPSLTPEIGNSRVLDLDKIALFVEGTMNVLKHHGIIAGPMGRTGRDTNIFVANSAHAMLASRGGFVEVLIALNDKVEAGQKVAIQRNAFGEVIAEYTSGVSGEILAYRTDATSEPGNMLLTVLYNRTPSDGIDPLAE